MEKKSNGLVIAIPLAIFAIIVLIVSLVVDSRKKIVKSDPKILTNYVEFYTVNSCLYRVITYINKNDTDSLLHVLNENYKKANRINSNNIMNYFPTVSNNSTFISKKMYYVKINSHLKKFYVHGKIVVEDLTDKKDEKDAYFIVYLDTDEQIFAIEPYDGKIFIGGEENG